MKFVKRTKIDVPVEDLFLWHTRNGAIFRMTPPWAPLKMISRNREGIQKGVRVKFRLNLFKIPMIWESEHIGYKENQEFKDRQIKGPFAKWEHTHRFIREGEKSSIIEDRLDFQLPFGLLSRPFYGIAMREFEKMFHYRHRVLKYDLENHVGKTGNLTILISGASGTIGQALIPLLQTCGHKVIVLERNKREVSDNQLFWNPYKGILDIEKAGEIDAVINLNGIDISRGRWTAKQKKLIIESRVIPTKLLSEKISKMTRKPEVFITSSAIGFYGDNSTKSITESDGRGTLFISRVCKLWEDAASEIQKAGVRTVMLRTGVVLTPSGGALGRMLLPFKLGLGVVLSKGTQYMSWISMDDEISAILFLLRSKKIEGPVNLTAPEPVTNLEFSQTLARVFSRKVFFTMPEFLVKAVWGQMGKETLLASSKVQPEKLLSQGFAFQHQTLFSALRDLIGNRGDIQ